MSAMNVRHGFSRITFALTIISSISGAVGGVAIVLHEHDMAHDNLRYLQWQVEQYKAVDREAEFPSSKYTELQWYTKAIEQQSNAIEQWYAKAEELDIFDQLAIEQQIETFFRSDELKGYEEFYGVVPKDATNWYDLTPGQKMNRWTVIEMTDQIMAIAQIYGRDMKLDEALRLSHLSVIKSVMEEREKAIVRIEETGFWVNLSTGDLVGLCIAAGSGGAVVGFASVWAVFLLVSNTVRSTVYRTIRRLMSYIAEAFRSGGKQMLSDIIKWTIIIITAGCITK